MGKDTTCTAQNSSHGESLGVLNNIERGSSCSHLNRLQLAQLPTPIHQWQLPGVPDQFEVFIKRDDLTGAALSGNKVLSNQFNS